MFETPFKNVERTLLPSRRPAGFAVPKNHDFPLFSPSVRYCNNSVSIGAYARGPERSSQIVSNPIYLILKHFKVQRSRFVRFHVAYAAQCSVRMRNIHPKTWFTLPAHRLNPVTIDAGEQGHAWCHAAADLRGRHTRRPEADAMTLQTGNPPPVLNRRRIRAA
jgi:hypothetical protein